MKRCWLAAMVAWVLWAETGPDLLEPWSLVLAYETREECQAGLAIALGAWKGPNILVRPPLVMIRGKDGTVTRMRYVCLPETMDPRAGPR